MFSFLKPSWCNLYSVSHELDCKSELKHIYNILMEEKKNLCKTVPERVTAYLNTNREKDLPRKLLPEKMS